MVVLSVPVLRDGVRADIWSIVGLLMAGLSWGTGAVIQSRIPVALDMVVSAGFQQVIGGFGLLFIAILADEPAPKPILEAWFAFPKSLVLDNNSKSLSFI